MKTLRYSFFLFFIISYTFSVAQVPVYSLQQFQERVQKKNDTLYVVNLWATWCKPCVEELPYFQIASASFSQQPVKIILASQDMKTKTVQVSDFLKKNNYTSETFVLSAGNPNVWINKIEPKWSGTIPVTLLYKNGKKIYFHEGDYADAEALKKIIQTKLK